MFRAWGRGFGVLTPGLREGIGLQPALTSACAGEGKAMRGSRVKGIMKNQMEKNGK